MSSIASDWLIHSKPPEFGMHQPNMILYHSTKDHKDYIIFTPWCEGFCYKYDIEHDEYKKIAQYTKWDDQFNPRSPGQVVHPLTNELWVFGGHSDCFGKFNLIHNVWTFIDKNQCDLPVDYAYPAYCFIPEPFYQLHAFNSSLRHIKYDQDINKFSVCGTLKHMTNACSYPGMAYISNKLLLFLNQDILCCSIHSTTQPTYEWIKCKLQLPEKMDFRNENKIIVAFNAVLLIFKFEQQKLWWCDFEVFDENKMTYEWMEVHLPHLKATKGYTFATMDSNNFIHLIDIFGAYIHQTVALSKLIPHRICQRYTDTVVCGFIKKCQQEINLAVYIPIDIVKVVLRYYI